MTLETGPYNWDGIGALLTQGTEDNESTQKTVFTSFIELKQGRLTGPFVAVSA